MNKDIKYVLLDTNIFIYREGEHELSIEMQQLTKILLDSNQFKLRIHPLTIKELNGIKNVDLRKACLSRANVYNILDSPPDRPIDFTKIVGIEKTKNDFIDNCILYSVMVGCVDYLITNDKALIKKASKIDLNKKVLSIESAISLFRSKEIVDASSPVFLDLKPFYNIDINDGFFDTLKDDYSGFENWFEKKKRDSKAYVSYKEGGGLGSFLSLKIEEEMEDYSIFNDPFVAKKRVKVSTMKVSDTGKRIGETFIKIMVEYALKNSIDEIYITVFSKQEHLINLLIEYGFSYCTFKNTLDSCGNINKENVYVKKIGLCDGKFPTLKTENSNFFIVPIRPEYHELLFGESEIKHQLNIFEPYGEVSCSNSIKKAYLSSKEFKMINSGDILFFYKSNDDKSLTNVGVVDQIYIKSDFESFEEFKSKVKKRTVYDDHLLRTFYNEKFTLIMFKHYFRLPLNVSYKFLFDHKIINGFPQSIQHIKKEHAFQIFHESKISDILVK